MAKKHLYLAEAERLFVIEQCTIAEIASQLGLGEKTVRLWKEEGDWDAKRIQYLQSRQSFHEELYEFAKSLMRTIKDDWAAGRKVDPGRMYAFVRLVPMIYKVKEYEDVASSEKADAPAAEDALQSILKNLTDNLT